MDREQAIQGMVLPGQRRKGKRHGGVIQIWVTRACDKSCFGCTQGSNLKGNSGFITLDQFDRACESLKDYFGIVGVFGGNPALHPKFDRLCEILAKHIPRGRRGLWCNNLMGKSAVACETFNPAFCNLNMHLDQRAYDEIKLNWLEARPFGVSADSRHSPPYVAIQDVVPDEGKRWNLISECDINRFWSAMICVVRGQLVGYFCEIAGAQAILHQGESDWPILGVPIVPGWWRLGLPHYRDQICFHCPKCGVPLRGYGELAQAEDGTEQVSKTHANIFKPKKKGRKVQLVTSREQLGEPLRKSTNYLGNAKG